MKRWDLIEHNTQPINLKIIEILMDSNVIRRLVYKNRRLYFKTT